MRSIILFILVLLTTIMFSSCTSMPLTCGNGKCEFGDIDCPQDCGYECDSVSDCFDYFDFDRDNGCYVEHECIDRVCEWECLKGCEDTDGYDPFKKGTVDFKGSVHEDECDTKAVVTEWLCQGGLAVTKKVNCRFPYVCDDGACIDVEDVGKEKDIKEEIEIEVKEKEIEVDDNDLEYDPINYDGPDFDLRASSLRVDSGDPRLFWLRICNDGKLSMSEINDADPQMKVLFISYSYPDEAGGKGVSYSSILKAITDLSDACREYPIRIETGDYDFYRESGEIQFEIDAYKNWIEKDEFNNILKLNIEPIELPESSVLKEMGCTDEEQRVNIFKQGWVTKRHNSPGNLYDFCGDEKILVEYHCMNDVLNAQLMECSFGCDDGECNPGNIPCTETDGGNEPFVKGEITGRPNAQVDYDSTSEDRCLDNDRLLEFYCGEIEGLTITVPSSRTCTNGCKDGACIR